MFLNFTAALRWKRSKVFARKALMSGHSSVRGYLGYGSIYHLFSRTLYGQIEKSNLRNRRNHSFEYIRTRLVLLDFIFANRESEYLETEQDKVTFFCEKLNVAKDSFQAGSTKADREAVLPFAISWISSPCFSRHLSRLLPLWSPCLTLIRASEPSQVSWPISRPTSLSFSSFRFFASYRSPTDAQFVRATERFRSLVKQPLESDMWSEVLRYFQVRDRFEKLHYGVPVTEDAEFLNEAKCRFHGDRFERLYKAWISRTFSEHELRHEFGQTELHRTVFFQTYLVTQHRSHLPERERGMVNVA
jgi:hypothetical protein